MKVIIIGAKPSSLYNFRGSLIKALALKTKNKVYAMASSATETEINKINNLNAGYIDYPVSRNGVNPNQDLKTFFRLSEVFKKQQPDVILSYTIKPIIWGGLASRFIPKCRFYALITGLGFAFQKGNWKKNLLVKLVTFLYKMALKKSEKVIFQNPDNQQTFIDLGIVAKHKTCLVNGSGVDVNHYSMEPLPIAPNFLMIARLLGDKGIREYIAAANEVKQHYPHAKFQLVGSEDPSLDGISLKKLATLNNKKVVDYLGRTTDVRPYIKDCSIFVLPSYHEGLPRTVLEAMATGRPILTTDVPGCKETVVNGENGWLVEKANVEQLVERMIWFIENQNDWQRMGDASRCMAEERFDVKKINKDLLSIMELV